MRPGQFNRVARTGSNVQTERARAVSGVVPENEFPGHPTDGRDTRRVLLAVHQLRHVRRARYGLARQIRLPHLPRHVQADGADGGSLGVGGEREGLFKKLVAVHEYL